MRPTSLAAALLTSGLFLTSHAQLIPFFTNIKPSTNEQQRKVDNHQQRPVMENTPGIQLPPPPHSDNDKDDDDDDNHGGDIILSDVMGSARQINIFASFCRDIDPVSQRLDTTSLNTTVLAPLNNAISDLPRKPWEDPEDYRVLGASAYEGKSGEDQAHANLRRFTEAHVVPVSPWKQGEKVESLGGGEVWWERDAEKGVVRVMPGGVEVDKVVQKVANGEIWVLKGVVNYAAGE